MLTAHALDILLTRHDVDIFDNEKPDTFNNFIVPESSTEHQENIISDGDGCIQMGTSDHVLTVKDVDIDSAQTKIIDPDTSIDLGTQINLNFNNEKNFFYTYDKILLL